MDELIKLLREYKPSEYDYVEHDGGIFNRETDSTGEYNRYFDLEPVIISKKFWFIKWLVDNDKIKFYKVSEAENELDVNVNVFKSSYNDDNYYWLLMILAISDSPIKFLVGILK